MKQFKHIVFAGTFDRLHIGHKSLLDRAFELADKVSIGITTDKMARNKLLSQTIEKLSIRIHGAREYLKEKNYLNKTKIFVLHDIYGPSTSLRVKPAFDSILVTDLTEVNAEKINEIRSRNGLKPLKIIVEPLIRGDDGEVVTSERIRMGEIDREGKRYSILDIRYSEKNKKELILPKNLREELRKPLGRVISGSVNQLSETAEKVIKSIKSIKSLKSKVTMVISVGDIVTKSLVDADFIPDVSIIDLRSRRRAFLKDDSVEILSRLNSLSFRFPVYLKLNRKYSQSLIPQNHLKHPVSKNLTSSSNWFNEPGTINADVAYEIKKSINKFIKTEEKQLIVVKGEEDLLALPAILFAPLQSIVLYGQFDLGVVLVEVTEEKKREVGLILSKFF